jgi:hypothetical protein
VKAPYNRQQEPPGAPDIATDVEQSFPTSRNQSVERIGQWITNTTPSNRASTGGVSQTPQIRSFRQTPGYGERIAKGHKLSRPDPAGAGFAAQFFPQGGSSGLDAVVTAPPHRPQHSARVRSDRVFGGGAGVSVFCSGRLPKLVRELTNPLCATDAEREAERVGGALPSRLLWRS